MITGNAELQLATGSDKFYNILRKNNIVYPAIEELGKHKYFYLAKPMLMLASLQMTPANRVYFYGKSIAYKIETFTHTENKEILKSEVIVDDKQKLLISFRDKNVWIKVSDIKPNFRLVSIIGQDVTNIVVKSISKIGYRLYVAYHIRC